MQKDTIFFTQMGLYNLGCEAIVRGTVKILRETCSPDIRFCIPSFTPEADRQRLSDISGIEIIPMSVWQGIRRRINRKTGRFLTHWTPRFSPKNFVAERTLATLSVGGDMYTLYDNNLPWDLVKMTDWLRPKDVPFVIWGASMESFEKRPDLKDQLLSHLREARLITARDQRTVDYLVTQGIEDNVKLVCDPAFWMDPIECDIEPYLPPKRTELCVGVNLSPLSQRFHPHRNLVKETAETVEQFIDLTGQSVVLVSHVLSPFPAPGYDDVQFHESVYQLIDPKYRDYVGRANKDIGSPRMKYLISQLDAYAGTRMHSTVASFSSGVPTLSLAYSEKALGLNRIFYDHDRWIQTIADFSPKDCACRLAALLDERDGVRKGLLHKCDEIRKKAMHAGVYLKESLDGC